MDKQTWLEGISGFLTMAKNHLSEEEYDEFLDDVADEIEKARTTNGIEDTEEDNDDIREDIERSLR